MFGSRIKRNRGTMKTHIHPTFIMLTLLAGIHHAGAVMLTNLVVSPASSLIAAGSNQLFTATGYYDDGTSQVLTSATLGGNWVAAAPLPAARSGSASVGLNGQVYVVGGGDANVYAYDPLANTWAAKAPIISPWCAYSGGAAVGNQLFIFGGCAGSDCAQTSDWVTIYDG
jgi:hypothetical protein